MGSRAALAVVLPLLFLGPATVSAQVVPSQDLGAVAVGGASAPVNINLSFSSTPAPANFRMAFGSDFHVGAASCHTGTCAVSLTFQPRLAGLRGDAVQALDSVGNLLASVNVKGIGLAPQLAFLPAALSTSAGTGAWGNAGDGGAASAALFGNPQCVAVDPAGGVYVCDSLNDNIRYISPGGVISTVAGTGVPGFSGDGGPAVAAQLDTPSAIALDAGGDILIADTGNNRIRRVDAVSHVITTVAGNGSAAFSGDGGPARNASLYGPAAVAVDFMGSIYIADTYNNRVRKVDGSGNIATVAGGGTASLAAVTAPVAATSVAMLAPAGLCIDSAGDLYIADSGNNVVAKLTTAGIRVVAGSGNAGFSGDGSAATAAQLQSPSGVAVDAAGDLYIADSNNSIVRLIADGQISTIAGNPGQFGFGGDGGSAAVSVLNNPAGLALDSTGKLYIADQGNRRVRMLNFAGAPIAFPNTVAGVITEPRTLTALNTGNEASTLTGSSVSNGFTQQASGRTDCAVGVSVAPSSTCFAILVFEPASAGAFSGSIKILDDTNNSPTQHAVQLTGTAVVGAAPRLSIGPAVVLFPSQALGTISNPQAITIANNGSAALVFGSLVLNGQNASDFQMLSTCGSSLPSGGACTVSLAFGPHSLGMRSATLTVNDDAIGSPHTVTITGTGTNSRPHAGGIPIPIFGTGLAGGAVLAAEGSVDPHWTIASAADWSHPGPRAYVVTSASLPAGWLANGPRSTWIAPTADGNTHLAAGLYVYHTSFDLTGLDANTAALSGTIAAGASATALLNGVTVPGFSASGTATQSAFQISSGFISGINTLDIVVKNSATGPTGLRLEISGSAQRVAAVPIAVFGTGVTKTGTLAGVGAVDSNYILESNGPGAYVVAASEGWIANGPDCNWIASSGAPSGTTSVFRTSFDLTGLNPSTAILFGHIAATGNVILKLNGTAVPNVEATNAANPAPFVIGSGFIAGVNVLEFSVTAAPGRPTGLRVDLDGSAQAVGPTAIPVWGTGSGSSGLAIDGTADAHYFLQTAGLLAAPGPAAYVAPSGSLPAGWAPSGPASKWISPSQTLNSAFVPGTYTYRTTFDLSGLNVATAILNGRVSASGAILMTLNGVSTLNFAASNAGSLQPFTLTNGFTAGVNTLEFSVITTSTGPVGLRVDLSGTAESEFGTASVSLSSTLLAFRPQSIGTTAAAQSVIITNTSTSPLQIAGIFPNGPSASDFGITTTCSSLLSVGASCSVAAAFTPSGWGPRSAFLELTDTSGDSPQVIALSGTGKNPASTPRRSLRARNTYVRRRMLSQPSASGESGKKKDGTNDTLKRERARKAYSAFASSSAKALCREGDEERRAPPAVLRRF